MFKVGDILVCVEEESGVNINLGQEVVLLHVDDIENSLNIKICPLEDMEFDYFQYADMKKFRFKFRPNKKGQ